MKVPRPGGSSWSDDFYRSDDESLEPGNSPKRKKRSDKKEPKTGSEESLKNLKEEVQQIEASNCVSLPDEEDEEEEDEGIWIVRRVHDDSSEEEKEEEEESCSGENDNIESDKVETQVRSCVEQPSLNRAVKHMCLHEAAEKKRFLDIFNGSFTEEDINRENESRETPLHYAAEIGSEGIVEFLLEKGANPNVVDADGFTPLILAANCGHFRVVETLLDDGADVNYQDHMDMTALHFAAYMGHTEVVRILLGAGADPLIEEFDGSVPYEYAALRGHSDVMRLLVEAENEHIRHTLQEEEENERLVYAGVAG